MHIYIYVLGRGAYGEVRVGIYQGTRVVVKERHDLILSDYNRELFEREMKIASCVRHPNFVLFVGMPTTGNLTIVNELMETSLQKLIMEEKFKSTDIDSISKDVACALVYISTLLYRDIISQYMWVYPGKYYNTFIISFLYLYDYYFIVYILRVSEDKIVNSYGNELLSLCKICDLHICNGRFPPDSDSGRYTCHTANGSSCVDYAITSKTLIQIHKSNGLK